MVGRGGIAPFDGDLDDYQRYLLDEAKRLREQAKLDAAAAEPVFVAAPVAAPAPVAPEPRANPQDQRKQQAQQRQQLAARLKPIRKDLELAEKRIAALEQEKAAVEARMATPLPAGEIAEAGRRLKALTDELAQLEERWMELSGTIEAAEAENAS
jgi:ATP-binding cassette subfamily F protein 3